MIFIMVSTARSVPYTEASLRSLRRNTAFTGQDTIVLIVNEPGAEPDFENTGFRRSDMLILQHAAPKGFAENMNIGIEMALEKQSDLMCLNNDIVFTPAWLAPTIASRDAIVLPACNQQYQYAHDGLSLNYFMTLDEFGGRFAQLDHIAAHHAEAHAAKPVHRELLMPFYCVFLPYEILVALGQFDASFGAGGAEDVDYRVRALLAGIDVRYTTQSYLLHFMGQSTWRSGEAREVTAARDACYRDRFTEKWGTSLPSALLPGVLPTDLVRSLPVADYIARDDYVGLIRACLDGDRQRAS